MLKYVMPILLALNITACSAESKKDVIVLSLDNTVTIDGVIDGESTAEAIEHLRRLDQINSVFFFNNSHEKAPIYMFLHTPGGDVESGLELIESVKGLTRKVNTITSFAASMGFQLVQNLDERLILQNGQLMSHRATGGFEGSFGGLQPDQLSSRYSFWINRLTELDEITVKRTEGKQTLQSYQKDYANEMWLTGAQAVKMGYADRIVSVRCDASLSGYVTKTVNIMGFKIDYDISMCPLNSSPSNVRVRHDSLLFVTPELERHIKSMVVDKVVNFK